MSASVKRRRRGVLAIVILCSGACAAAVMFGLVLRNPQTAAGPAQAFAEIVTTLLLFITVVYQWWYIQDQLEAQRLQSMFLPYLAAFQNFVHGLECGALRGHHVLEEWARIIDRGGGVDQLLEVHSAEVRHYANRVEVLLRVLSAASVSESHKEDYLALLRAQFSERELVVLKAFSKTHVGHSLSVAIDDFRGLRNAGFLLEASRRLRHD